MKLDTAHIIMIGTAIAFFLIYALFEASHWWSGLGTGALLRSGAGVLAAGVFAVYLRSFVKSLDRGRV